MRELEGVPGAFADFIELTDGAMYVVTTADGSGLGGCLVGFAGQCSIEPPRFVVWLSEENHTFRVASGATHLAVHLIPREQLVIGRWFGETTGDEVDPFVRVPFTVGPGGVPLVDALPHRFVGEIVDRIDRRPDADHVGHVLAPVRVDLPGPQDDAADHPPLLRLREAMEFEPGHPVDGRGARMTPDRPVPTPEAPLTESLDQQRSQLLAIIREKGYERRDEAFTLSSGQLSHDFIDGKRALAHGPDLALACRLLADTLARADITFDAIGGLTMGADQFAHGVAIVAGTHWFVVRKEPKGRGTNRLVEGMPLASGTRVVMVDDVVSTGASTIKALDAVEAQGAEVVAAVTLVDRGDAATAAFAERGIPYFPLLTYRDLGIDPVRG